MTRDSREGDERKMSDNGRIHDLEKYCVFCGIRLKPAPGDQVEVGQIPQTLPLGPRRRTQLSLGSNRRKKRKTALMRLRGGGEKG